MRIGQGYDIHPLAFGRPLVLGGVEIPEAKGARGWSDADCLTHAVVDAILGAAGLGDIGHHFPDDDENLKDVRSIEFLEPVAKKAKSLGYMIINIDASVIIQAPKLAPYKTMMAQNIAEGLGIQPFQVNVKAKSAEGLGPVGQGEAVEAQAVCLLDEVEEE